MRRSQTTLAAIFLVCLFLMPLVGAAYFVYSKHQWAQARLGELSPRFARLTGVTAEEEVFKSTNAAVRAKVGRLVFPGSQDVTKSGNDAQQLVREALGRAGLQVVSSQVLPPVEGKPFQRIPLVFRAEGELIAVQSALVALGELTPAVFVSGWSVQSVGAVKAETAQRLTVQLNVAVLRALP